MLEEYLDTKRAIEAALRDYRTQEFIVEHGKDQIRHINRQLTAIPTGMGEVRSSTPYSGNNETRRVKNLDKKTLAVWKYERACGYMSDINPGLEQLSPQEKDFLTIRYIDHEIYPNGIAVIMKKYNVSKREAYRMCDNARDRLAKLVYGK